MTVRNESDVIELGSYHEWLSSLGLGLVFAAIFVASTGGVITGLAVAVGSVASLAIGLVLARCKTWPVMAVSAVLGGLATLCHAGNTGATGPVLFGAVSMVVVCGTALGLRMGWLLLGVAAALGAFVLFNTWYVDGVMPPILVYIGLATTWLTVAVLALVQKSREDDSSVLSSALAITTAVAGTVSVMVTCGVTAAGFAPLGLVIIVFGLVYDKIRVTANPVGQWLAILGVFYIAGAMWAWFGVIAFVIRIGRVVDLAVSPGQTPSRLELCRGLSHGRCGTSVGTRHHPPRRNASGCHRLACVESCQLWVRLAGAVA